VAELAGKLGPEYIALVGGPQAMDPDSKGSKEIGSTLDALDKLRGFSLWPKKVGRPTGGLTGLALSAHVGDALLGICLSRGHWPRRQLKHRCRLPLAKERQQHGPPVRKFERIVMHGQLVLVDLSKDGRLVVDCPCLPPEQAR
jgi:hypothetical protein